MTSNGCATCSSLWCSEQRQANKSTLCSQKKARTELVSLLSIATTTRILTSSSKMNKFLLFLLVSLPLVVICQVVYDTCQLSSECSGANECCILNRCADRSIDGFSITYDYNIGFPIPTAEQMACTQTMPTFCTADEDCGSSDYCCGSVTVPTPLAQNNVGGIYENIVANQCIPNSQSDQRASQELFDWIFNVIITDVDIPQDPTTVRITCGPGFTPIATPAPSIPGCPPGQRPSDEPSTMPSVTPDEPSLSPSGGGGDPTVTSEPSSDGGNPSNEPSTMPSVTPDEPSLSPSGGDPTVVTSEPSASDAAGGKNSPSNNPSDTTSSPDDIPTLSPSEGDPNVFSTGSSKPSTMPSRVLKKTKSPAKGVKSSKRN